MAELLPACGCRLQDDELAEVGFPRGDACALQPHLEARPVNAKRRIAASKPAYPSARRPFLQPCPAGGELRVLVGLPQASLRGSLRKTFSGWELLLFGIGIVIGTGIYSQNGTAAFRLAG